MRCQCKQNQCPLFPNKLFLPLQSQKKASAPGRTPSRKGSLCAPGSRPARGREAGRGAGRAAVRRGHRRPGPPRLTESESVLRCWKASAPSTKPDSTADVLSPSMLPLLRARGRARASGGRGRRIGAGPVRRDQTGGRRVLVSGGSGRASEGRGHGGGRASGGRDLASGGRGYASEVLGQGGRGRESGGQARGRERGGTLAARWLVH